MTLYQLTAEYTQLMEMAEDEDLDPETLRDTFEGLEGEIEDKADGYAKVIRTLEGDVASIKSEIERLTAKKNTIENNISNMKRNLEYAMTQTGKTKFKTQLFSFNIQKNAPSLDVIDEKAIPANFWIQQEPKLDRRGALDYIKQNGDQSWGILKQTESLRIR